MLRALAVVSAMCPDISRLLELPVPRTAQAHPAVHFSAPRHPLANGGRPRPRPPFSPQRQPQTVDVRAEKDITGNLTTVLSKASKEDIACLRSLPALYQTTSPWRKACCLEYLDALAAAYLEAKPLSFRLPRACAASVSAFLWKAPEKGKYLADFIASQNHKSKDLCKSVCRSRDGKCMWTRGPCCFFHPSSEVLLLARERAGGAYDLYAEVQAILREREEEQGAAAKQPGP